MMKQMPKQHAEDSYRQNHRQIMHTRRSIWLYNRQSALRQQYRGTSRPVMIIIGCWPHVCCTSGAAVFDFVLGYSIVTLHLCFLYTLLVLLQ